MSRELESARQARKGVEIVRRKLLRPTPESMAECVAPLAAALACVQSLERDLQGGPTDAPQSQLRAEMRSLRQELGQTEALLTAAGRFWEAYGRLLGHGFADSPSYGPTRPSAGTPQLTLHG